MFVKHTLHAEHYMRYMDDFVIISEDLEQLKRWEKQIEIFLADVLKLQLNPKTTIVYAKNGVDFVGYRHWNSTKKIRMVSFRHTISGLRGVTAPYTHERTPQGCMNLITYLAEMMLRQT